jgi:hypothetical protein
MTDLEIEIQKLKDSDQQNVAQHQQILDAIQEINKKLEPLSDTYKTATRVGKWFMAVLVFISILFGVIANFGKFLKFFK